MAGPSDGAVVWSEHGRARPVRTCVGCRERAARSELLRVVAVGNRVVPDTHVRQPGRGAHLHPRQDCLQAAERRRAFPRALRAPGPLDTAAVHLLLDQEHHTTPNGTSDR